MKTLLYVFFYIASSFFFVKNTNANAISFKGYYIEVLILQKNGMLVTGEFILEKDSLKSFLENPNQVWENQNLKRIFNYTSLFFFQTEPENLPKNVSNIEQIDWNYKVSLYRGNDLSCNKLYRSLINKNYAFYIKEVEILIESLGDVEKLCDKFGKFLSFRSVEGSKITNISKENFLLLKILEQQVLDLEFIKNQYLLDLIKPISLKKVQNLFNPYFTVSQINNPSKNKKLKCNCYNYFPNNW